MKKIYKLFIKGLQGYLDDTEFYFSDGMNLIRGANSAGKTAIRRIMETFQCNIHSQDKLASLLNEDRDTGYVDLVIFDTDYGTYTTGRLVLYRVSEKSIGYYYEIYDGTGQLILREERFNENIARILGFETIEEPNGVFSLNFKESKYNAFVDTSQVTNGYILDGLCYLPDYELRINNIKDAIVNVTNIKTDYSKELKYRNINLAKETFTPTVELEEHINKLESIKNNLEESFNILSITCNCIDVLEDNINLDVINNLLQLINFTISSSAIKDNLQSQDNVNFLNDTEEILKGKINILRISEQENWNSHAIFSENFASFCQQKTTISLLEDLVNDMENDLKIRQILNGMVDFSTLQNVKNDMESAINDDITFSYMGDLTTILENTKITAKLCYVQFIQNLLNSSLELCVTAENAINSVMHINKYMALRDSLLNEQTNSYLLEWLDKYVATNELLVNIKTHIDLLNTMNEINEVLSIIPKCPTCGRASI